MAKDMRSWIKQLEEAGELFAALSGTYSHQKFAIAVDKDVDIYDLTDIV